MGFSLKLTCFVVSVLQSTIPTLSVLLIASDIGNTKEITSLDDLNFVATVEGKTYFSNPSEKSWMQASNFCENAGLRLASITSENQWNALVNAYAATTFFGAHWTSGRKIITTAGFSWDDMNSPIDLDVPLRYPNDPDYVVLYSSPDGKSRLYNSFSTDDFFYIKPHYKSNINGASIRTPEFLQSGLASDNIWVLWKYFFACLSNVTSWNLYHVAPGKPIFEIRVFIDCPKYIFVLL